MENAEMLEALRKIRVTIETDEKRFNDEDAERIIEKVDSVIHELESVPK